LQTAQTTTGPRLEAMSDAITTYCDLRPCVFGCSLDKCSNGHFLRHFALQSGEKEPGENGAPAYGLAVRAST
jgi:hypothetical protein